MKKVELSSLTGKHVLLGVDTGRVKIKNWGEYEDANYIKFNLDGINFMAVEDPSDGYRSSMKYLRISKKDCKNKFPGQPVKVEMNFRESDGYGGYTDNELAQFFNLEDNGLIMEVGTRNTEDYYPYFVSMFNPKELSINKNK